MVVIRINGNILAERAKIILEGIHNQARAGVIVVPHFCEVLHNDEDDEIKVICQDARVAELEAELAAAMKYITEIKDCITCKYEMAEDSACLADCENCSGEPCAHICQHCTHGSKWEWRGAHGAD